MAAQAFAEATFTAAVLETVVRSPRADAAAAIIRLTRQQASATGQAADAEVLAILCQRFAGLDILADSRAELLVVEAAPRLQRRDASQRLLSTMGMPREFALLRNFGAGRRMAEMMEIFHAGLENGGILLHCRPRLVHRRQRPRPHREALLWCPRVGYGRCSILRHHHQVAPPSG